MWLLGYAIGALFIVSSATGFILNVVEIVLLIIVAVVVLLVEAIPWIVMQIERDLYIPMLLQALGMAGGIAVEL
ncbi:hypothetical protein E2562_034832 [Oryza meyeriana var. granulata]|uniref:Uncharacterized protein n=1 Tax=Oryza meyeriana var. granulata TaxID=110450 RepID=A0A6G1E6F9_9ORYZ|nr:hypothetical protein E2562_034832 [Oryza meyeriana var. granulata]